MWKVEKVKRWKGENVKMPKCENLLSEKMKRPNLKMWISENEKVLKCGILIVWKIECVKGKKYFWMPNYVHSLWFINAIKRNPKDFNWKSATRRMRGHHSIRKWRRISDSILPKKVLKNPNTWLSLLAGILGTRTPSSGSSKKWTAMDCWVFWSSKFQPTGSLDTFFGMIWTSFKPWRISQQCIWGGWETEERREWKIEKEKWDG